jgi:vancomycin resistance protein YoaR
MAEWRTVTSAGNTSDESGSDSIQALLDELLGPSGHDNPASTTDSGIRIPTTTGGEQVDREPVDREPVDREPVDRGPGDGATFEADPVQSASAESASVVGRPPGTSSSDGSPKGLHDGKAAHGPTIDTDGWTVNGDSGAVPGHEATQVMDRPIDATVTMPAGKVSPVITGRPGAGAGITARRGVGGASVLKVAVLTVLGLYAVLVAAWSIDLFRHQGEVMRGIEFADTSLQGMSRSVVGEVVERQNGVLAERSLEISVGDVTVGSDPVTAGATLDGDAITAEAFDHGRIGFFPFRPVTWVGSFFGTEVIEEQYTIDADRTVAAAEELVAPRLDQPREPELLLQGEQMVVTPGEPGITVNSRELVGLLPDALDRGEPYRVSMQSVVAEPTIDETAVRTIADEVNSLTATALRIQVLDDSATVDPATLKSWVVLKVESDPTWSFATERVLDDIKPLFPTLGSEDQRARFNVVDEKPIIVPAAETVVCCDEESFERIRQALADGPANVVGADDGESDDTGDTDDEDAGLPVAVLEPKIVDADQGVAELESLGIIEQVSTFTTNHSCCQNRVTNIHRIADLTRGAIIRPGETFSLNGFVGRRTRENGFVADGAINLGVLEPQVGGGISQYATTLFNAAFYAGMEFVEYQSHSLYISRYPRGREATISWPRPDLKIKNTTDYGILLWNSYTSTSITVTMYSTKHLDVVDLPLRRSSDRQCRIDITPRLITFPDGTTVEDSVFAVYRPGEGLDCNGNSTRPELTQENSNQPAEPPPADDPPPEDPPAEDPPAEDPPAEDPPAGDGNGAGDGGDADG